MVLITSIQKVFASKKISRIKNQLTCWSGDLGKLESRRQRCWVGQLDQSDVIGQGDGVEIRVDEDIAGVNVHRQRESISGGCRDGDGSC
jgi:hypothetical protein